MLAVLFRHLKCQLGALQRQSQGGGHVRSDPWSRNKGGLPSGGLWFGRWSVLGLVLACPLFWGLAPSEAGASTLQGAFAARVHVSIAAPSSIAPGGLVLLTGRVSSQKPGLRVVLQERDGASWRSAARAATTAGGAYLLSARAPHHRGPLELRVMVSRGKKLLATSTARSVRVRRGAPSTAGSSTATTVVASSAIKSLPAPGTPGTVVLAGDQAVTKGSVLAASVGPSTPYGFLGMVVSVSDAGGETSVQTAPTTLQDALPEGTFELADATQVNAAGAAAFRPGVSARAASGDDNGALNEDLAKAISCEGGATFSATGSVGLSATPKLSLSWSLFHGVSASFTETVTASASLSGSVSAAGSCVFQRTGLLPEPADLGTFVGDVLGVPVVVTLEGQIYLDGKAEAQGSVSAGISGQASASGGLAYSHGKVSIIGPSTSLHFGVQGPTVQAGASVGAHVTPELQVLLYGVGGPVFDATTGLDFAADTQQNPWWTLTSPLTVTAALEIPDLGLSSPVWTLYSHTFTIAQAPGPFGPVAPPPPPPPAPAIPSSGPTLVFDGDTAIPEEDAENGQPGDRSFVEWAGATGESAEVQETLPASLSSFRCVALLDNEAIGESEAATLNAYIHEGGTIVVIGEHEGAPYGEGDEALNHFAESLGVGLTLAGDSYDYGPNVTSNIYPSPLTEGVSELGDNWVSSISVSMSGSAQPLVGTAEGSETLVGEQPVGRGTFVMAGDSNMFTDDNEGFYEDYDNGQFVRDLCP
jgi:hypothetical protein